MNFNHIYQHFGYINGWSSPAMDSSGQLATIFYLSRILDLVPELNCAISVSKRDLLVEESPQPLVVFHHVIEEILRNDSNK